LNPLAERTCFPQVAEWKKWMRKTGKPELEGIRKIVVRNKATEEPTPKLEKEDVLLAAIKVPTGDFHKKGLEGALNKALPMLHAHGGFVTGFVEKLDEAGQEAFKKAKAAAGKAGAAARGKPKKGGKFTPPAWLPHADAIFMRRGLDQLVQEFVMDKVGKDVFPLIEEKVTMLGKEVGLFGPMMKKLKGLVFDLAEVPPPCTQPPLLAHPTACAPSRTALACALPACAWVPDRARCPFSRDKASRL
jgi:hypothetical protein